MSQPRFRKQLILPAEHGSWSWLLVPFGVGAAIAGSFNLPVLLVLLGGLSGFLLRQPATVWLRVRQGRGRRRDGPLAARLLLGLGFVAALSLAGLLALGRTAVLWLLIPLAGLLLFYLAAARSRRTSTRTLHMELAGAAGLALMAPAAMIAADGRITSQVWTVWGLMALQNVLGVYYVRQRIDDTHGRPSNRKGMLWSHVLGGTAVLLAVLAGAAPPLTLLPFAGFLLRAAWTARQPRPVTDMKRFGFTEVGAEIVGGLLIILAYLLN